MLVFHQIVSTHWSRPPWFHPYIGTVSCFSCSGWLRHHANVNFIQSEMLIDGSAVQFHALNTLKETRMCDVWPTDPNHHTIINERPGDAGSLSKFHNKIHVSWQEILYPGFWVAVFTTASQLDARFKNLCWPTCILTWKFLSNQVPGQCQYKDKFSRYRDFLD